MVDGVMFESEGGSAIAKSAVINQLLHSLLTIKRTLSVAQNKALLLLSSNRIIKVSSKTESYR